MSDSLCWNNCCTDIHFHPFLQVNELGTTVKEQHAEMKQRITTMESSLRKYEIEIQERTKQVRCLNEVIFCSICNVSSE